MSTYKISKFLKSILFALVVTLFFGLLTPIDVSAGGSLSLSDKGYTLKQVVVLSRHNIRAPMSTKGSTLEQVTPYEWYNWSSNASELSLRGGVLETEMGQYFKKWLESDGLIPENYHPDGDEVRFYSNSKQRTIATAKYFSAGLLPTANIDIEYHVDFDKMDPTFTPALNFVSDEYINDATAQTHKLFDTKVKDLSDNYELIADVIDMDKSEGYSDYVFNSEYGLKYVVGQEPTTDGSLKLGTSISDALVLQYYEEADALKAGFGNDLTLDQWKAISEIKDVYGDVLFTAPLVATNVANPLIKEIYSEMNTMGRIFTFLCGHDSNIGSVLAALGVKDYELPDAIDVAGATAHRLVGKDSHRLRIVDDLHLSRADVLGFVDEGLFHGIKV
jgi:glucose-1-phosphatase